LSADEIVTASPEHFDRAYRDRAERFARVCREQSACAVADERWLELARATAEAIDPAVVCIDAPSRPTFAARIAVGLTEASRQASERGVELVLAGLRRIAQARRSEYLVHGTGSWALSGILRDGALIPGGDGMTGEVALTNLEQSDLFVCVWDEPTSMYAALAFAYMNAGTVGDRFLLSALRAGRLPIAELFGLLLFGSDPAAISQEERALLRRMLRYRTLEHDSTLARAYERARELARRGELPGDGRQYTRRLGAVDDDGAAFTNACATVVAAMRRNPELMKLPSDSRLAAGVLAHATALERALLCPMPSDDADEVVRKQATLGALKEQFPVVLVIDGESITQRRDPGYPWSTERLVGAPIPADRIVVAYVPLGEMPGVERALVRAGLGRAVAAPMEELEGIRLVSEAVPDRL
jgi:hypothetical protein